MPEDYRPRVTDGWIWFPDGAIAADSVLTMQVVEEIAELRAVEKAS